MRSAGVVGMVILASATRSSEAGDNDARNVSHDRNRGRLRCESATQACCHDDGDGRSRVVLLADKEIHEQRNRARDPDGTKLVGAEQ